MATPISRLLSACLFGGIVVATGAQEAGAGGGPENVFLLVNDLSDDSKTIANHYIRWRNLPDTNVFHVDWRGSQELCVVERFRNEVLRPALEEINRRKLGTQIDYLVYSAGFPWQVDLRPDHPGRDFPPELRPLASTTGATYLWRYVLQKNVAIVIPNVNWYVAPAGGDRKANTLRCASLAGVQTRGFRSRYVWEKSGDKGTDSKTGQQYLLSTMLGVTTGRGNTVDEVLSYLQAAISADGQQPDGTFYFVQNNNARSKPRHDCYQGVAAALRAEGARVKITSGKAPIGASDIVGLTTGSEYVDLPAAGSKPLGGSICDNLTSYGGDLKKKSSQTALSEFLRLGASGASGTVAEPRAIQAKFPLPSLQLHYRRGCSLAEAFYQSVSGPYQLLIVGDPLCQPWAEPPRLVVEGLEPDEVLTGRMELTPRVNPGDGGEPQPLEIYFDGRLLVRAPSERPLRIDTAALPDGHHELRVVVATDDAIEARARVVLPIVVDNDPNVSLELEASPAVVPDLDTWVYLTATAPQPEVPANTPFTDQAKAPKPSDRQPRVVFEQAGRRLGVVPLGNDSPATAKLRVRARTLGRGPIRLRAQLQNGVQAAPEWIVVR
ncbi:MAG: TIGR03790 family protein [Planctomycetota bacterium]